MTKASPYFRAAVVMNGCSRLQGGMYHSIQRLWRAVHKRGQGIVLHGIEDEYSAQDRHQFAPVELHAHRRVWRKGFEWAPGMMKALRSDKDLNILQLDGLWLYSSYVALRIMKERKLPLIINPHGMMDPWAMANSRWKKRIVGVLWHDELLRKATCFRALCQPEVEAIRTAGVRAPISVVPNGVDLSEFENLPPYAALEARFPALAGRKRMLFMARLHPKKGLPMLLDAWAKLPKGPKDDWVLFVAGEGTADYEAQLRAQTAALGLEHSVVFAGNVVGTARLEALSGSDAFILPSYSEGFSMAILEASTCRLPVIQTGPCNFPELAKSGGAIEVSPTPAGIEDSLSRLFAMSDGDRKTMGEKGRRLIESSYTWDVIAAQMEALCLWQTGAGSKPDTVQ